MRRLQKASFLSIIVLALIILELAPVISSGTCDYCHGRIEAEQQRIWMREAFNFLYCDNCYQGFLPYNFRMPTSIEPDDNDTAYYWQSEGNRQYLAGSYEQSAASYAEAVKLDPYQSESWLNMGDALYFVGRYIDSIDAYNALLQLEPQNVNALKGKSQALLALNRTEEYSRVLKTIHALESREILRVGSPSYAASNSQ